LGLAVLLAFQTARLEWIAGILLLLDLALFALPWRIPRHTWSGPKFWLESLLYLVPLTSVLALAAASRPDWLRTTPSVLWIVFGLLGGGALITVSRIDLRALTRGDLAFLLGESRESHAWARAFTGLAAPVPEEAVFRGIGTVSFSGNPLAIILSGLAFVSRHRLIRGAPAVPPRRVLATELAGAATFGALALGSGSIVPSIIAHVVANLPRVVIEIQRAWIARSSRRRPAEMLV
jgi:Type II CAAX prenyl endopeptidase Rce1-like